MEEDKANGSKKVDEEADGKKVFKVLRNRVVHFSEKKPTEMAESEPLQAQVAPQDTATEPAYEDYEDDDLAHFRWYFESPVSVIDLTLSDNEIMEEPAAE